MEKFILGIESIFSSIGLGPETGASAPMYRFLFVASSSALVLNLTRPSLFFDPSGQPKPWILLNEGDPQAIVVPWWAASLGAGAIVSLFI